MGTLTTRQQTTREAMYLALAKEMATDELEVDDDATVSLGADDDGAFVQCWVWIPKPEVLR